jgi:cytochrome c-type biogenesis protein CcmH
MTLWILLAVLTAVVIAALMRPLSAGPKTSEADRHADVEVYRDQLMELDRDREAGLLSPADAEAARAEVGRRLLQAAASSKVVSPLSAPAVATEPRTPHRDVAVPVYRSMSIYSAVISAGLPVAAVATYLAVGSPAQPSVPFADRAALPIETASVAELIGKVEARLRDNPMDAAGWDALGPVYALQGRFADAADAYAKAMRLSGESPRRLAGFAESAIRAENGIVTDAAREAYVKLAAEDPANLDAMFWIAVAAEQNGDTQAASQGYRAVVAAAQPGDLRRAAAEERLASIAGSTGRPANDATSAPSGKAVN